MLALEALVAEKSIVKKLRNIFLFLLGYKKMGPKDFPHQEGLAWETIHTMTHRGTHMDAPYHFGSMCGQEKAKTIEEVPLEWCFRNGLLLDFTHKKAGEWILRQEIIEQLQKIRYEIKPLDIVLIKTGCDQYWNKPAYLTAYPGLSKDALYYLLDKGVKIIGIDSYSLDRPSFIMMEEYKEKGRNHDALWPCHFAGRDREYCHIEQLAHLDKINMPTGFKICCFPMLIEKGSAGWCRVVAIIE
ncbi:cyclase family protein [Desulforamulus ruminis DSM 2154]|uniref:Cyclase family protein n=1 Tax=Desulforamulus ruminis (strain ATCC 23193 / DSM 2154 / NCIMB 8452 / DL) TaxID=696281 RepID=F6DKS1_DESRL|nr:cyclase family protein [Desulforamulus ruminis DSM 2154]